MRPAVTLVLVLLLVGILGAAVYQFAIADGPTLSSAITTTSTLVP